VLRQLRILGAEDFALHRLLVGHRHQELLGRRDLHQVGGRESVPPGLGDLRQRCGETLNGLRGLPVFVERHRCLERF